MCIDFLRRNDVVRRRVRSAPVIYQKIINMISMGRLREDSVGTQSLRAFSRWSRFG